MPKLKEYKMYINGAWVDAENKKTFQSLNPENNEPWAIVPEASAKDVNKAVDAAQKAFEGEWPKLLPRERANYLRAIANQLRENAEMLGKIETIDTGKLFRETKTQANYIAEYYDYYAGLADKIEGSTLPIDKPDMYAFNVREPLGVVAAIVPWNSQLFLVPTFDITQLLQFKNLPLSANMKDLLGPFGIQKCSDFQKKMKTQKKYDIAICMQTLEHISDEKVGMFARKLFKVSDHVLISVPYMWKKGKCPNHLQDPVDESKIYEWINRNPTKTHISTDKKMQRIICYYDESKKEMDN